jgi:hypothetical protein
VLTIIAHLACLRNWEFSALVGPLDYLFYKIVATIFTPGNCRFFNCRADVTLWYKTILQERNRLPCPVKIETCFMWELMTISHVMLLFIAF